MSNVEKFDIVVIGGGPSGISLAKVLGRKVKMAVVRQEYKSMIYCAMPYAIEGLMPIEKVYKKDELITGNGAVLIRGVAEKIDFGEKKVILKNSGPIKYDKLIIATGAYPFIPPIEGSSLDGVMGFKTEDDLRRIKGMIDAGLNKAVVVGAGAIGVELAQALKSTGLKVTLIDMADSIVPNMLDKDMMNDITTLIPQNGIGLILNARVSRLEGKNYVERIILSDNESISFEDAPEVKIPTGKIIKGLVVFSVGVKPDTTLLKDSGIEIGKDGIIVNSRMETNLKDVYACGDCAQFKSGITGKVMQGKLATNAVPMAKVLGRYLAGEDREYPGFYNGAATKIYDYYVGGTGFTEKLARDNGYDVIAGYGKTTTRFSIMPGAKILRVKLIADRKTGRIIGGQIVSGEPVAARIDLITFAIQRKCTVKDLTSLSYAAQPYQSFFPAANAIVLAAEDALSKFRENNINI